MKKALVLILLFIGISIFGNAFSECKYSSGSTIGSQIDDCLISTDLISGKDLNVETGEGFKATILGLVQNISIFLSVISVGSIVYGALLLTLSTWEDEKIKKGKDIVKWGIIGFFAIISAGGLIGLIINMVYGLQGY